MKESFRKYVIIIPDGAPDLVKIEGMTPLEKANLPNMDFTARNGVTGLMQTLFPDLPKGSLVAQLGMLGWDPTVYYPYGRASAEASAIGVRMSEDDIAFRANLVLMEGRILKSYSANFLPGVKAQRLVEKVNSVLKAEFPDFELYHTADFRNVLIVRDVKIDPRHLLLPEPHEHQNEEFDIGNLVKSSSPESQDCANRLNLYLSRAAEILQGEEANALFLWSPSAVLKLNNFKDVHQVKGKCGIVGNMDFLKGIAAAGGLDFFLIGNGYINTDYRAKGRETIRLLEEGYKFVYCHINAPDEAAHMGNIRAKIESLEKIDEYVVRPVVEYFQSNPEQLGGLMIAPDHYTNTGSFFSDETGQRKEAHSDIPIPFCLWNNNERDGVEVFNERSVKAGKYGSPPIPSSRFLSILGISFK